MSQFPRNILVFAMWAILSWPAVGVTQENSDDAILVNQDKILAVTGVSSVTDIFFRGRRLTPDEVGAVANSGIKFILNLQGGDLQTKRWFGALAFFIRHFEKGELQTVRDVEEKAAKIGSGIGYVNIPLNSLDPVNSDEAGKINQVLMMIHSLVSMKLPVYLHCEHGRDRTGLLVAFYRIRYEGWSVDRAYQEWRDMGHHGFWDWLITGSLGKFFYNVAPGLAQAWKDENAPLQKPSSCHAQFHSVFI